MDLYFQCPRMKTFFRSSRWSMDDGLRVVIDHAGRKQLQGYVYVPCPLCGEEHAFRPEELGCPLTMNDAEKEDE